MRQVLSMTIVLLLSMSCFSQNPGIHHRKTAAKGHRGADQAQDKVASAPTTSTNPQQPATQPKPADHDPTPDSNVYSVKVISEPTNGWFVAYVLATILLGIIGLGTLYVIWQQRNVMQSQLGQMQSSGLQTDSLITQASTQAAQLKIAADNNLKAAQAAVSNARSVEQHTQAVMNSERAWVFTEVSTHEAVNGYIVHSLTIKNTGRTPAVIETIQPFNSVLNRGEELPPNPNYYDIADSRFESTIILLPDDPLTIEEVEMTVSWWVEQYPEIATGAKKVYQYGIMKYRDVLPDSPLRETRYCYQYIPLRREWRVRGNREYTKFT